MIKYVLVFLFSVSVMYAQNDVEHVNTDVKVGDVYKIGNSETSTFKHIDFPRANFIIKKGGIANYKSAIGQDVVVSSIKEKKDGSTKVYIKRKDGGRFFGSHKYVTADINQAVASGELTSK